MSERIRDKRRDDVSVNNSNKYIRECGASMISRVDEVNSNEFVVNEAASVRAQ